METTYQFSCQNRKNSNRKTYQFSCQWKMFTHSCVAETPLYSSVKGCCASLGIETNTKCYFIKIFCNTKLQALHPAWCWWSKGVLSLNPEKISSSYFLDHIKDLLSKSSDEQAFPFIHIITFRHLYLVFSEPYLWQIFIMVFAVAVHLCLVFIGSQVITFFGKIASSSKSIFCN